ncbi:MAG: hypothetical protein R2794_02930 [Chitinophagales bacterium]
MKWGVLAFAAVIAVFWTGCSTDFDLNADFKETPVVYGLLDASTDTQYIRINRAFLSDNIDALTLAANPDSIYYGDELSVRLDELNNGVVVQSWNLERVDGDTLGIPKAGGTFANIPNILYRLIAELDYTHQYFLYALNANTGKEISAQIDIVDAFAITRPDDASLFPQSISLSPQNKYSLLWKSAQDARIYDLIMRFHYREGIYSPEGDSIHYTFSGYKDWVIETNYTTESTQGNLTIQFQVDGASFYNWIADAFEPVADFNFIRIADSAQFIIDAGGNELYTYFQYNNATLGITEGQVSDVYTNINGGLGILSSRYHKVGKVYPFAIQTRDSIACSAVTSGLNFAPDGGTFGFPFCQ